MITTILIGISLGCVYGFVAMGFSLIYRTTGIMNFSQGGFVMVAAMATGYASAGWGWPYLLAAAFGLAVSVLCGLILCAAVILPLWKRKATGYAIVLGTLLFGIALENIVLNLLGSDPIPVERIFGSARLDAGVVSIDTQAVVLIVTAIVLAIALAYVMNHTKAGLSMRAVATDQEVATLLGIQPHRVAFIAFGVSAAIAGIGGILIAPMQVATWNMALIYNTNGFIAAVLGGVLDIRKAFLGGVVLGLLQTFIGIYVSTTYLTVFMLGLLLVLLVVRPNGIFSHISLKKFKFAANQR